MPDFKKIALDALEVFDPEKSAGTVLMLLNAAAIGFAALSNTFAAATDKHTSAEDKKFLVPAGLVTGIANLGIYFGMTKKLVDFLEKDVAGRVTDKMKENKDVFTKNVGNYVDKLILKAQKSKSDEYVKSMVSTLKDADGNITDAAKSLYTKNVSKGLGVVGAFIGAVVGCAIITPILRDVSAYAVQKWREKNNPSLQDKPYTPYFDPAHIGPRYSKLNKQPLSMTSYMNFTHGRTRV